HLEHSEMELNWKLARITRPSSATVRVTDLGWQSLNPSPLIKDDEELLVDEYLSPNKLRALTGLDDLQQVRALEMRVDTRENTLGNFGTYLPNLKQLKLNNSVLTSVRDLGTALSRLQVLWMVRCGLPDLDGISSCCSLRELYIAYNNISDIAQVSQLEHLEILDLEGNNIEDLSQIQYLGLCTKLSTLTVEGNLICLKPSPQSSESPDYNYRAEVKKLIPHLKYLDEIPADQTVLTFPCKMNKDWLIVKESIKEGNLVEEASGLVSRPQTAQKPPSAHLISGCSVLLEPTVCDEILPEDNASDLTHGVSRVICGNPIKALHARRQKLIMTLFQPPCHPLEDSSDSEDTVYTNGEDIFAELKVLKEQHYRHLQALQRANSPQVLTRRYSYKAESHSLSDNSDEDMQEAPQEDILKTTSLDSSCQFHHPQSSSDSSLIQENVLPTAVKHCLMPSPPKSPSPASVQGMAAGVARTRRLKVANSKKAVQLKPQSPLPVTRDAMQHMVEKTAALSLHRRSDPLSNASSLRQRHRTCSTDSKQSRRPISGPAAFGPTNNSHHGQNPPQDDQHPSTCCSSVHKNTRKICSVECGPPSDRQGCPAELAKQAGYLNDSSKQDSQTVGNAPSSCAYVAAKSQKPSAAFCASQLSMNSTDWFL
ncbi:Leucine-rich repeat-containing protein 56, partial [Varanus komodoensis]